MLEGLEARRLLAASAHAAVGNLNIHGSNGDDSVLVTRTGSDFVVTIDGVSKKFAASKVTHIFINGLGGHDTLLVDDSVTVRAHILGGPGNDRLRGGGGPSILQGGGGDDILEGGLGADVMFGNEGIDTADYSTRGDNLTIGIGTQADDGAAGEGDNVFKDIEIVLGGAGNDVIRGSAANNTLVGNAGNDILIGGAGDDDLSGGAGNDTVDYSDHPGSSANIGVLVQLNDLPDDGLFVDDALAEADNVRSDIETVNGSAGPDHITGFDSAVSLKFSGQGGNDSLDGGLGNDTLEGGAGDDSITGSSGDDYCDGGTGSDSIGAGEGDDVVVGGPGAVSGSLMPSALVGKRVMTARPIASAKPAGSAEPDRDYLSGDEGNDRIEGGDDNDTLSGSIGDDTIYGGDGDDQITGEEGKDLIDAGNGNDIAGGGDGGDTIDGGAGTDILFGDDGADELNDDGAADPNAGPAIMYGGAGKDNLKAQGNKQQVIIGDDGDDYIEGGEGDDILDGALGNDTIFGLGGNDTIAGGFGRDDLHGNGGNDAFINDDGNSDTIHGGDDLDVVQEEASGQEFVTFVEGAYDTAEAPTIGGGQAPDVPLSFAAEPAIAAAVPADQGSAGAAIAVSVNFAVIAPGNQLQVFGSGNNDNISITFNQFTFQVFVTENGVTTGPYFPSSIYVNAGLGNDNISLQNFNGTNSIPSYMPTTVEGAGGNDTIRGGDGNDFILGGGGNDSLMGAGGNDFVAGGDGDDYISGGSPVHPGFDGHDNLSGGGGASDFADYSARTAALILNLDGFGPDGATYSPFFEFDTIGGDIEHILGGKGADHITGNFNANFLSGGLGSDTIRGGGGNDSIVANVNDWPSEDRITGNDGWDFYYIEDWIRDHFYGVGGVDYWRDQWGASGTIDSRLSFDF